MRVRAAAATGKQRNNARIIEINAMNRSTDICFMPLV